MKRGGKVAEKGGEVWQKKVVSDAAPNEPRGQETTFEGPKTEDIQFDAELESYKQNYRASRGQIERTPALMKDGLRPANE